MRAMSVRWQSLLVLMMYFSSCIPLPVFAARVQAVSYSVIPASASTAANHSILFQTKSAISSGTIKLYLSKLISSTGSIDYSDVDFSYGATATTAAQNELSLAAAPGNSVWGVAVDAGAKTLTLTYPSAGAASIPAMSFVSIVVGTHAYSGAGGSEQFVNSATAGAKSISLSVGTDSHLLSVGLSASATATASATTPDLVSIPSAPTALVLTSGSGGVSTLTSEIDVAWTDNSSDESYFSLERKTENGAFSQVTTTTLATYNNVNLSAGTTYVYRVSAVNGAGASAYSGELTVSTATVVAPAVAVVPPQPPSPPTPAPTPSPENPSTPQIEGGVGSPKQEVIEKKGVPPPTKPSQFSAAYTVGSKQIKISWSGDSANATQLELQRMVPLGVYTPISNLSLSTTALSATDSAVQPKTTYTYRLKITGIDGVFVYSTDATVVTPAPPAPPPAAPTDMSAVSQSGVIALSWTDNATNETGFEVLRRPAFKDKVIVLENRAQGVTTYSDADVTPGMRYTYRLRAINTSGVSDFTSETVVSVPRALQKPGAPALSAAYSAEKKRVDFTWTYTGEDQVSFQLLRKAPIDPKYLLVKDIDTATSFDGQQNRYIANDPIGFSQSYQYVIRANNGTEVADSNEVSVSSGAAPRAKPSTPAAVTVVMSENEQKVVVQWKHDPTLVERVEIQRNPALSPNLARENGSVYLASGAASYSDFQFDLGKRYQYRVRTVNESVVSAEDNWSAWAEITTPAAPAPKLEAPSVPAAVEATPQTDQLVLNWSPSIDVQEYRIERRLQGEQDYDILVNTSAETNSYIDATALAGDLYEYRITPVNDGGDGAPALVSDATVIASAFKKSQTQIVYAPPLVEEKVVLADGGVVKTENKAGAGLEVVLPKDVTPIVEGAIEQSARFFEKTETSKTLEVVAEKVDSMQSIPALVQEKTVESIASLIDTVLEKTPLALLSEKEKRNLLETALAVVDETSTIRVAAESDFKSATDTAAHAVGSLESIIEDAQHIENTLTSLSALSALSDSVEKLTFQPTAHNKSDIQSISADLIVETQTIIDSLPDVKLFSQATQEKITKADTILQKDLSELSRRTESVVKGVEPLARLIETAQSVQESLLEIIAASAESSTRVDAALVVTHAFDVHRESNKAKNALESILVSQSQTESEEVLQVAVKQEKSAVRSVLDSSASLLSRDTVRADNSQESKALVFARGELIDAQTRLLEVLAASKKDAQEITQAVEGVRSSSEKVKARVSDLVASLATQQNQLTDEAVKEVHIQALEIKRSTSGLIASTEALLDVGSKSAVNPESQDDLAAAVNRIQQAEDSIKAKTQKFIEILSDSSSVVSVSQLRRITTAVDDAKTTLEDARENYRKIIGLDVSVAPQSSSSLKTSVATMTAEQVTSRLESIVSAVANVVPSLRKYVVSSSVQKEAESGVINDGGQGASRESSLEIVSSKAPLHISINPLSPTRSLVEHTLGSGAILDSQPAEFKQPGGVGPAYIITANIPNTTATQQSLAPVFPRISFFQIVKAFVARIGQMIFSPALAQTSIQNSQSVSTGSAYPSYQAELPVTKFDPSLSYVFKYTPEDIVNVDENTIKLYSWDEVSEQWKFEQSKLDVGSKTVMAEVGHLSIFRLFGESLGIPPSAKKNIITVPSNAMDVIASELSNENLGLANETESQPMTIAKTTFYTTPNTAISMCIPGKIFKKSVKKILLSIGSARYTLNYQKARDCYATRVSVPDTKGRQAVVLKVIYIDDQTQIVRLETEITGQFEAQLLTTVIPALQQVQAVAVVTNTAVQKSVQKTQPVLQTAAIVTAPIVTVANPVVLSQTINFFSYIGHFVSWILSLLGLRRRRKQWGVVYDAIAKTPIDLAIVRLFDAQSKKLIETQVTDKQGRFSFLATPGTYTLSATKLPYVFPSAVLRGVSDGEYTHLYHGESIVVKGTEDQISMSIPLDPPAVEKAQTHQSPLSFTKGILVHVSRGSLIGGFVVSILLAVYTPSAQNTALLVVNWIYVSYQVFVMVKKERPWGVVFDALTLKPVPLAAISIFDAKEKKLLRTRLSDYEGRFTFLTPPGEYLLSAYKDQYVFPAAHPSQRGKFAHPYVGGELQVKKKNQTIKVNIPLDSKPPINPQSTPSKR